MTLHEQIPDSKRFGFTRSRGARFIVVGAVNTAFSYSLYAMLVFLGLHYTLANLTALVAGILFSFRTQGAFVFNNTERSRFLRFVVTWAVIYLINIGLIRGAMVLGFDAYVGGALAIAPTAVLSYLTQKHFVFREQGQQGHGQ
jgi:putative flippase GtrA